MTGDQDIIFMPYVDQIIYSKMNIQHTLLQYHMEIHRDTRKKDILFQFRLPLDRFMT